MSKSSNKNKSSKAKHGQAGERKLTEDGVSEVFFRCLWMRDELSHGVAVNIPDTVVFKYGQPVEWYFTNHDGLVKKKNKQNLLNARIEETFNKHVLGYDVIAVFYRISPDFDPKGGGNLYPTTVEYYDRTQLSDFLYKGVSKDTNGILQRFIEPKSTKNEMIRAVWSPKVCLLERAENIHELHDERYGMYERCVTYEGPEYYCSLTPLRGPVLAGQIQAVCENISSHIGAISFGESVITRMTLNFKVDSRDKIWLLYSSSVRLIDRSIESAASEDDQNRLQRPLLNIDNTVQIPNTVNLSPNKSYNKIVPKKRILCLACSKESLEDLRYPITYKSIIKHYEHVLHLSIKINGFAYKTKIINWPPEDEIIEAAGGVGFAILNYNREDGPIPSGKLDLDQPLNSTELRIPPILRHVHPKLTAKNYAACHKDPLFIYKTVNVCESCYLIYAEFTTMLLKLGQDLKRLLEPDQKAVDELKEHSRLLETEGSPIRPSSSDWRAMSNVGKSLGGDSGSFSPSHFKPSANHIHAKEAAVGLLREGDAKRGEPPKLPARVQRGNIDFESLDSTSNSSIDSSIFSPIKTHKVIASHSESSSPVPDKISYEDGVQKMIREREQHFYKEVSRNPNLKDQHPLMHLITAQQKLKLADESGGVSATKAALKKENVFGTTYGKQSQDSFNKYGVYNEEIPYIVKIGDSNKMILPSVFQKQKEEQRAKRTAKVQERKARREARRLADTLAASDEIADADYAEMKKEEDQMNAASKAAADHRHFLHEAMTNVEKDLSVVGNRGESLSMSKRNSSSFSPTKAGGQGSRGVNFQVPDTAAASAANSDEGLIGPALPGPMDRPSTTAQGLRGSTRQGSRQGTSPARGGTTERGGL